MPQTLDVGEPFTVQSDWYDGAGIAAEPTDITLTVFPPFGAPVVVVKLGMTGSESGALPGTDDRWTYTSIATLAGTWHYDIEGIVDGDPVKLPSGVFIVGAGAPTGPCEPWTTWDEVEECASGLDTLDSAQRELVIDQASEILWNLTGRVYSGMCETTRSLCFACRTCWPRVCGCEPSGGIDLGIRAPVWAAWDVVVDGVTLPTTAYKIVNRRWLTRIDGHAWPSGQDVTDPTAFRVTWAYGRAVPGGGRAAARLFAAEIAKLCAGMDCQLPQRVTNIQREGMSYTILDPMRMVAEGQTGLALVDLWIASDKRGRKAPPGIFAPAAYGGSPQRVIT